MSELKNSYNVSVQDQHKHPFVRPFTIDGFRTSLDNMNVDGSIIPVEFWAELPPDQTVVINTLILSVSDNGAPAAIDYGNITGGLPNGLQFFIDIDGERVLLLPVIRQNIDAVKSASIFNLYPFSTNDRVISYQKRYGEFSDGLLLDGRKLDKIGVIIQDDCTSLLQHHVDLEGYTVQAKV